MNARPLAVALVLVSALLLSACGNGGDPEDSARPALVARPGAGVDTPDAFAGEVRARHEPALSFRIGGKILRRQGEVGDRVKAGQVLAELDAADVGLQLESARAQVASAEADLALAKSELDRYRSLLDRQLVSRSLFETRESAWRAAQARVRQARAQASVSGNQASYATLRAPKDGVIAQRLAEAGQVVAPGQTVFVLAEDGEREVVISVPEHAVEAFKPGRELRVELWASPGKLIPGVLREISPVADSQSRTYAARVSLGESPVSVDLGQSARVYAPGAARIALAVPLAALHAKDGQPAVWKVDPASGKVSLTPVQIGPYGEDTVAVLSGLGLDDWVVAAGVHLLREGQRIKPIDRNNRAVELAPAGAATPR